MKYHIVCLKWGTKYNSLYVNRLYNAIVRNLTLDFEFHCFTDDPINVNPNITIHPLFKKIDGWWNKLYLFSKDMPIQGKIFYIDLDTLITGNIDHLVFLEGGLIVLRDFFHGYARDVYSDCMGSGLMSWNSGQYPHIWDSFIANPDEAIRSIIPYGDQRWIQHQQKIREYWQDIFPNHVVSFKVHCREELPKDARVVCYHGKPSIPESITETNKVQWWTIPPQSWVAEHWK